MAPSKREILEKYRDVISNEDFEILVSGEFPAPQTAQQEGVTFQYLGTIKGWYLFVKRHCGKVVTAIVFMGGGFIPGLEYIGKYSTIAYEAVSQYADVGRSNSDIPATEYVVSDRPLNWGLPPDEPIRFPITTTTTTTTTTQPPGTTISPGSGIAPFSPSWRGYS
jgi:hypothetical protein